MQLMHDSDCEWRLGHDCTCAKTDPRDATIARLTSERDEARASAAAAYERAEDWACQHFTSKTHGLYIRGTLRALAAEAESNALAEIVKKAVDAETRACAEVVSERRQGWLRPYILARLNQRKEAGE